MVSEGQNSNTEELPVAEIHSHELFEFLQVAVEQNPTADIVLHQVCGVLLCL